MVEEGFETVAFARRRYDRRMVDAAASNQIGRTVRRNFCLGGLRRMGDGSDERKDFEIDPGRSVRVQ
jgi:hypothetical protein